MPPYYAKCQRNALLPMDKQHVIYITTCNNRTCYALIISNGDLSGNRMMVRKRQKYSRQS